MAAQRLASRVSWLLRKYRHTHGVALAELRALIDKMRYEFGVPYPLADQRACVSGKEFLAEVQDATELNRQGWLVITRDRHIQDHRAEIEAVRSSGARMINWRARSSAHLRPA